MNKAPWNRVASGKYVLGTADISPDQKVVLAALALQEKVHRDKAPWAYVAGAALAPLLEQQDERRRDIRRRIHNLAYKELLDSGYPTLLDYAASEIVWAKDADSGEYRIHKARLTSKQRAVIETLKDTDEASRRSSQDTGDYYVAGPTLTEQIHLQHAYRDPLHPTHSQRILEAARDIAHMAGFDFIIEYVAAYGKWSQEEAGLIANGDEQTPEMAQALRALEILGEVSTLPHSPNYVAGKHLARLIYAQNPELQPAGSEAEQIAHDAFYDSTLDYAAGEGRWKPYYNGPQKQFVIMPEDIPEEKIPNLRIVLEELCHSKYIEHGEGYMKGAYVATKEFMPLLEQMEANVNDARYHLKQKREGGADTDRAR